MARWRYLSYHMAIQVLSPWRHDGCATCRLGRTDLYAFAYYAEEDPAVVNPLDLGGWCFYVVPTLELEAHFGTQEKVALSRIPAVTLPETVGGRLPNLPYTDRSIRAYE